jgi:hypothetical protein
LPLTLITCRILELDKFVARSFVEEMGADDIASIRQQWQGVFPMEAPPEFVNTKVRPQRRTSTAAAPTHPKAIEAVRLGANETEEAETYRLLRQAKGELADISHELIEWSYQRDLDQEEAALLTLKEGGSDATGLLGVARPASSPVVQRLTYTESPREVGWEPEGEGEGKGALRHQSIKELTLRVRD